MLIFPDEEIARSRDYYRDTLARQPRLDFDKPWQVSLFRVLANLSYLDRRPLRSRGLKAETRRVDALGRKVHVRIIRPRSAPRAVVLDIHGGGWTLAKALTDDPINAELADAGFAVVSVEYRYAPKHPLADVIGDCETALAWAIARGEAEFGATDLFLTGDSAGAHLAVASALRRRDAGADLARLKAMVLFYGCYDLAGTSSVRAAGSDTLVLNGASLPTLFRQVTRGLGEEARRDPSISPLYADLRGLPPALLIAGTDDPLIDDSRLMAERLAEAGVQHELAIVPHAPHSFNRFPIEIATRANGYARDWMTRHSGG